MKFARKITIGEGPSTGEKIENIVKTVNRSTEKNLKKVVKKKVTFKPPTKKTLDSEIKRILQLKLDDRRKWTLYQEVLHEFLVKPKKDVLEHVKYKDRAIKLLDTLSGIVTWTEDGTVSVKGQELPYSHVADLVEAYFEPSRPRPIGWDIFKTVLPLQFIDWPPVKRSPKPRKVKDGKRP